MREYSFQEVDRAGAVIAASEPLSDESQNALAVVNNWQVCHAFPLNTLRAYLWRKTKQVDRHDIVAQRIKRLPAISGKRLTYANLTAHDTSK